MPRAFVNACLVAGCSHPVRARGRCATHSQQRERQRSNVDVRRWYRTARWTRLRRVVLIDEPLCAVCLAERHVRASTDVHHKVRHGGAPELFWDRDNLTSLCHAHHSAATERGE